MATVVKSTIISAFKLNGLTLRSEASRYLLEVLLAVPEADRQQWLDLIIETVQSQPLKSSMIDSKTCQLAVQECNAEQDDQLDNVFNVIDTFSVPRYTYAADRKKFIASEKLGIPSPSLHGKADDKTMLFKDRYALLHQRTLRHELFTPLAIGAEQTVSTKFQLKPVEFLLGSTTKLGEIIVLGMLTQMKEGKWYLEDPTGAVQLDLTKANFHTGLFTENCFVLAEGWYEDEVFHINAFGLPPAEPAAITRSHFGSINFFGGPSATCVKSSAKLRQYEQENGDAMMIFLSDVWLDDAKVLDKLRILFSGYASFPPTAFVLCGNFLSKPGGQNQAKLLKEGFENLAEILTKHTDLIKQSKFVFVPGPNDPGPATILPRPYLPKSITDSFENKISSAIFATNPCRIQYCTQEILVFREDIVTKMCRNCVKFPADGNVPMHFAKTVTCQGHLCSLPLHVCPVYWAYDYTLRVYPLPDMLVCADRYDPFTVSQTECNVINPGSFPRTEYGFKVYFPASKQIEDSKIGGAV